jgi:MFS family permease
MLPVVLTMISNWFPDAERGRANAIVIMFVPIAGIITAPLSGWIITILDWRWLFIIEGLVSGGIGPVGLYRLRPSAGSPVDF